MAGQIHFNRNYAAFGPQVEAYEKADEVGIVVTKFLWYAGTPFYPIGALVNAKISGIWLGEGERPAGDARNIDLIFKMGGDYTSFYEVVLRSDVGTSYGGYFYGDSIEVTDEIVAGHRVVLATVEGSKVRYEFDPGPGEYVQVWAEEFARSTSAVRQSMKNLRRR